MPFTPTGSRELKPLDHFCRGKTGCRFRQLEKWPTESFGPFRLIKNNIASSSRKKCKQSNLPVSSDGCEIRLPLPWSGKSCLDLPKWSGGFDCILFPEVGSGNVVFHLAELSSRFNCLLFRKEEVIILLYFR